MPKARSPERDQAYELYKNSKGLMPLREIARQLNVPEKAFPVGNAKINGMTR